MTTVTTYQQPAPTRLYQLRLVWTLARKDIVDALKNRSTLSVVIISVLMVAFYRYFPSLAQAEDATRLYLHAEDESVLITALERSPALALYRIDSPERVFSLVSESETPEIGIIIPVGAQAQLQRGEPVVVEGYTMSWLSSDQQSDIQALLGTEFAASLDDPGRVEVHWNTLDLHANGDFFMFSASFALVFLTVMVGISLIPNLMLEEKHARTLDMLLVSPASAAHIVAGKAVAGLFYSLIGCGVVLVFFRHFIVQWPLAILAALTGSLIMIAIGLLLGSYIEVRAQLQMLAWIIILPLMAPMILVALKGLIPDKVIATMQWIPTVIVARVFRLSFTVDATFIDYAAGLAATLAMTIALFGLVVWVIRRQDRS